LGLTIQTKKHYLLHINLLVIHFIYLIQFFYNYLMWPLRYDAPHFFFFKYLTFIFDHNISWILASAGFLRWHVQFLEVAHTFKKRVTFIYITFSFYIRLWSTLIPINHSHILLINLLLVNHFYILKKMILHNRYLILKESNILKSREVWGSKNLKL